MQDGLVQGWRDGKFRLSRAQNAGEYIPTWQEGQSQSAPEGRRYIDEGYGKNSLIYACIAEKATSFASLRPQVERLDGQAVANHRLVELLEDPNTHQDGQDFGELMATQFDAAGNVYIKKVRQSSSRARRSAWSTALVQELELIRPDYVSIVPGATREQDVYEVSVGGRVVDRIASRDMIHIHEPLVINDFYGVPKIQRLLNEGDVDISMTQFELAFFRNAGVPMGLLQVKGRMTEGESTEVKRKFRAAYNGLRRWFDLLILNSDEATYTQMGMKQSDMELDSTRFHAESRICTTFGVPGIIVGARYAMQAGAQTPYEEAQHAFWAETMVPLAQRFGRAFGKHLLPEFATSADRGATVTYDFTQVRALQEDRSRKLREVTRLVTTGAFTVNQALATVGLPLVEDGDFYIRNGNQVVVDANGNITPMMEPGGEEPSRNPDNPLTGAALLREAERIVREGR